MLVSLPKGTTQRFWGARGLPGSEVHGSFMTPPSSPALLSLSKSVDSTPKFTLNGGLREWGKTRAGKVLPLATQPGDWELEQDRGAGLVHEHLPHWSAPGWGRGLEETCTEPRPPPQLRFTLEGGGEREVSWCEVQARPQFWRRAHLCALAHMLFCRCSEGAAGLKLPHVQLGHRCEE